MDAPSVVWFRQDLRIADNAALAAACARGGPVIGLYVLDDETPGNWRLGAASRWWLHHSLAALAQALAKRRIGLVLRRGRARAVVPAVITEARAGALFLGRRYEPWVSVMDAEIESVLRTRGVAVNTVSSALLYEPESITKRDGTPYAVFSAFWRACRAAPEPAPPQPVPKAPPPGTVPPGEPLLSWRLCPRKADWAGGLRARWTPGEDGARARLAAFIDDGLARYDKGRDRPAADAVSALSPHLHFGEISPRTVWHAVASATHRKAALASPAATFQRELGWREFAHHLLFHHPHMPDAPLKAAFASFPWQNDDADFAAWCRGETGYPLVDAGMRELWTTGYVHNRVRMIVASFLVKHLLIPWQRGEAWFWDTLVDADLANNAMGWQWIAGSGVDAAPYFRIFNPVLQGERFDPEGAYVRHWVPEIGQLPDKFIHKPWAAPRPVLAKAGVTLGTTYPLPVIDHDTARARALAALETLKRA